MFAKKMAVPLPAEVNPAVIRVTPEIAAQWLETMRYEHQRAVRQVHVEFLAEEMRRERFIQGTQLRFVSLEGEKWLVDGQHRLWAVITAGIPQYFSVLTTRVETKEEAAWIYGNTDIGLRRSGADLFGPLELGTEFQLSKTEVRALSGVVGYMFTGCLRSLGGNHGMHRDDAVRCMRIYAPYARQYFKLIAGCEQVIYRPAVRAATLSAALLALRFSLPRAEQRGDPSVEDFWRGAVFDDGIQIGDPRKVANRHLLSTDMSSGGNVAKGTSIAPAAYSTRILANCFNAYMERRPLTFTRVLDNRAPLNMYGVPNDHTRWW